MGINLEGFGGDVQCVPISALHGTNLDQLADAITTQATLMDLKSEYTGPVEGVVVESKTDPHRGYFTYFYLPKNEFTLNSENSKKNSE